MGPLREVANIVEVVGERGGVQLIHVLDCGHWISRRTPRSQLRCTGCEIERKLADEPNVTNVGARAIASQAVEAALAAAVGVFVQHRHDRDAVTLTNQMARAAFDAARPFLDALGAPTDGESTATGEAAESDRAGQGSD